MKRMIRNLLVFSLAILMCGCGNSVPAEPDKKTVEADVQEYITELVDDNALVKYLSIDESIVENKLLEMSCIVKYESETHVYEDEFLLTYTVSDGVWNLSKCKINDEYAEQSVIEISTEENSTEENIPEKDEKVDATVQTVIPTGDVDHYYRMDGNYNTNITNVTWDGSTYDGTTPITVENITFSLPCKVQDLLDRGFSWYSERYENQTVSPWDSLRLTLKFGPEEDYYMDMWVANLSGDSNLLAECQVIEVDIVNNSGRDYNSYEASFGNIKLQEATVDDLNTLFGTSLEEYGNILNGTSFNSANIDLLDGAVRDIGVVNLSAILEEVDREYPATWELTIDDLPALILLNQYMNMEDFITLGSNSWSNEIATNLATQTLTGSVMLDETTLSLGMS